MTANVNAAKLAKVNAPSFWARRKGACLITMGLSTLTLIACSTDDFINTSFGGSGGVSFDSGTTDPGPEPEDPCDQAVAGNICFSNPSECEIGTQVNAACSDYLECESGKWAKQDAGPCVTKGCPTSYQTAPAPGTCDVENAMTLRCEYDEGTCGCTEMVAPDPTEPPPEDDAGENDAAPVGDAGVPGDGGSDSGLVWKCAVRSPGCPRIRPRIGTSCVKPLECDYGHCIFEGKGLYLRCDTTRQWVAVDDNYGDYGTVPSCYP